MNFAWEGGVSVQGILISVSTNWLRRTSLLQTQRKWSVG